MGRNGKGKGRRLYTKKYSYVNLSWPGLPLVYLPCPHQHLKTPTIDRKTIDRDQHINLLSTPKGYRWDNPQDNNKKQMACKPPPKKKFLCVEASGNNTINNNSSNNKQYGKTSMDDVWKCMTPELMEKLIGLFVNDFQMTKSDAKEFICEQNDTNKMMQKLSVCPCPCASGDAANQNIWMKEFSELIACKLRNQLALVLCGRRNRRQKLLMELVVSFMSEITGECINIACPETRIHRILVYAADRIALWLDRMLEETEKKMAEEEALEREERARREEERRRLEEERLRKEKEEKERLERERLEREKAEADAAAAAAEAGAVEAEAPQEEVPPPEEVPVEEEPPPAEAPPPPPPEGEPVEEPVIEEAPPEAALVGAGEGEIAEAPVEEPEVEPIEVEPEEPEKIEEEPVEEVLEEEAPPEIEEEAPIEIEIEPPALPPMEVMVEPEVSVVRGIEPMDVIVDWIKGTEYDRTERQEKISGIVKSRLLTTLKDQKDVEGMAAAIDFLGNQVSTWIDKLAAEAEKEIRPLIKTKSPRFSAPKGVLYHIKRGSDNYYKVRQVSCTELESRRERFDRPMSSGDVKDFTKWAEGLIKVSDAWTRWVENAFCEAYTIYNRNADQPSELTTAEFKCWREAKRKEAIEWKRTQKSIFNKAKMWENWAQYTKKEIMGASSVKGSAPTLQE